MNRIQIVVHIFMLMCFSIHAHSEASSQKPNKKTAELSSHHSGDESIEGNRLVERVIKKNRSKKW